MSQMANAFGDGGKAMQPKQIEGNRPDDRKICRSIAVTQRGGILSKDNIFRVMQAILNVPMVANAMSEFVCIGGAGTDVKHRFMSEIPTSNASALNPNQSLDSDPGGIESNNPIQNTDRPLRGAVSRVFKLVYHAVWSLLLKLIVNPLVELGLILFHRNHIIIATVDNLLHCFFGCAVHPC